MADSDKSSQSPESPCPVTSGDGDAGPQPSVDRIDRQQEPPADGRSAETRVTNESSELRKERLRRIREDVSSGRYDVDEFLKQALKNLLKRISSNTE